MHLQVDTLCLQLISEATYMCFRDVHDRKYFLPTRNLSKYHAIFCLSYCLKILAFILHYTFLLKFYAVFLLHFFSAE